MQKKISKNFCRYRDQIVKFTNVWMTIYSLVVKVVYRHTLLGPGTEAAHCAGTLFFKFDIFFLSVRVRRGGVGISYLSYDAMPILSHNRVSGPYEKSLKRQNRFAHCPELG